MTKNLFGDSGGVPAPAPVTIKPTPIVAEEKKVAADILERRKRAQGRAASRRPQSQGVLSPATSTLSDSLGGSGGRLAVA